MSKTVYIEYFGMTGQGETLKDAKLDAGNKIETAMKGDYTPTILTKGSDQAVVYRTPTGWNYLLPSGCVVMCSEACKASVIESASFHLEQMGWDFDSDDTFPLLDNYPTKKRELQSWARWQRDYKRLKDLVHDDQYCHEHARA